LSMIRIRCASSRKLAPVCTILPERSM
jgi:hypothetical protein